MIARQRDGSNLVAPPIQETLSFKATWIKSASTTIATVVGQAPSFLIPLAAARILGATAATDAFFVAFALVSFALTALLGATQYALVPFLIGLDSLRARSLIARIQTLSLGVSAIAVMVLVAASSIFLRGAAPFVLILLPFMLSAVVASIWTAVLYAERSYITAALTPVIRGLGVLVVLWAFGSAWGVYALVCGYVLAEGLRAWVLAVYVRPPTLAWRTDVTVQAEVAQFLKAGGSQAAGSALIALVPVIDRLAAAPLAQGSVSLLDYAERVCQAPVSLLMSGFLVVSLAQWSHDVASGGDSIKSLRRKAFWNAVAISVASITPVAFLIAFRQAVARILFGTSHLSPSEIATVADTLGGYLLGVPVLLAGLTYTRAFLALRRSDWLLKVSVGQLGAKFLLNSILAPAMGLPGIALATAMVYALGSVAHVIRLHWGPPLIAET